MYRLSASDRQTRPGRRPVTCRTIAPSRHGIKPKKGGQTDFESTIRRKRLPEGRCLKDTRPRTPSPRLPCAYIRKSPATIFAKGPNRLDLSEKFFAQFFLGRLLPMQRPSDSGHPAALRNPTFSALETDWERRRENYTPMFWRIPATSRQEGWGRLSAGPIHRMKGYTRQHPECLLSGPKQSSALARVRVRL